MKSYARRHGAGNVHNSTLLRHPNLHSTITESHDARRLKGPVAEPQQCHRDRRECHKAKQPLMIWSRPPKRRFDEGDGEQGRER